MYYFNDLCKKSNIYTIHLIIICKALTISVLVVNTWYISIIKSCEFM